MDSGICSSFFMIKENHIYKDNQTYQNFFEYMNMMLDSEYLILVYYYLTQEPTPFLRKLKTKCWWNKNGIQLIHAMLSSLIQFIYKNKKIKKKPCYPFYLHCNTCKGLYALKFFFFIFFFFDTHNNRGDGGNGTQQSTL